MNIQRANGSHIDELMVLITDFYNHFDYPFEAISHRKMIEYFLANEHLGSIWLIRTEGHSVGYIALANGFTFELGGRDAFVDEFFISEPYRNRGYGRLALQTIFGKMDELGLVALHLMTENYNERAKRLYESIGFQDLKRSTLTWRPAW